MKKLAQFFQVAIHPSWSTKVKDKHFLVKVMQQSRVLAMIPICFRCFKVLPIKRDTAPSKTVYRTTEATTKTFASVCGTSNPISRNQDKSSIAHRSLV